MRTRRDVFDTINPVNNRSGNSGNWLLNSLFGAAEYRLALFRHRYRAKRQRNNEKESLRTRGPEAFFFVLPGKSSLPEYHG